MTAWLDPLRLALDEHPDPVTVFFRDDDAGWADDALRTVMDLFAEDDLPLDVAVIPAALTPPLAHEGGRNRHGIRQGRELGHDVCVLSADFPADGGGVENGGIDHGGLEGCVRHRPLR